MISSWFFLSTLNYDARSTTHQRQIKEVISSEYTVNEYVHDVPRQKLKTIQEYLHNAHRSES